MTNQQTDDKKSKSQSRGPKKPHAKKPTIKKQGSRVLAAIILVSVSKDHHSLDGALQFHLPADVHQQDAAFIRELCYGSLRHWIQLQALVNACMERPLRNKDADINAILILGLYQLKYMRVPDHAALSESVNAVEYFRKSWARKLVNGVLRTLQRTYDEKLDELKANSNAYYNHPDWMLDRIQQQWPQQWQDILAANDKHPPLVLRVNTHKISVADCIEQLAQNDITAHIMPHVATAIRLEQALDITALTLFRQGMLSVQDAAAQCAAPLLSLQPQDRVLDVCAAPGGKTGHILECQTELESVTAVEIDSDRCNRIQENMDRLGYKVTLICADAIDVDSWWDNKLFDKILLDVPCSASGVMRRHPDIKLLRTEQDIDNLQQIQQQILVKMWPLLRPGGSLLYVTCSIFEQENEQQIQHFLETHSDAQATMEAVEWGESTGAGRQILPGSSDMDGFYFCLLQKNILQKNIL